MNFAIRLFNFYGSPVYLRLWFLILLIWLNPIYVSAIFISILLHELAHAFIATRLGHKVTRIYVDLFNGAAEMDLNAITDRESIKIVFAGPWINSLLMLIFFFLNAIGYRNLFVNSMIFVNFYLLVFNLIPIFPLDGGRILRSFLNIKIKDKEKATRLSSVISLIFSIGLLAYSISKFSVIMIVFALLFILFSLKELRWFKQKE